MGTSEVREVFKQRENIKNNSEVNYTTTEMKNQIEGINRINVTEECQ